MNWAVIIGLLRTCVIDQGILREGILLFLRVQLLFRPMGDGFVEMSSLLLQGCPVNKGC